MGIHQIKITLAVQFVSTAEFLVVYSNISVEMP